MRVGRAGAGLVLGMALAVPTAALALEPSGYVGAGAGRSRLHTELSADGLAATIDDEQTAWKLFGGGRLGVVGLEGGYVDFGRLDMSFNGTPAQVHATGFEGFATLNLRLGPATLFAKGGALNWTADAEVGGLPADRSGTAAAWGAGAIVQLTGRMAARAEYEAYENGKFNDFNLWSVGLELTF
jgi:opacity protein-like surface antigen